MRIRKNGKVINLTESDLRRIVKKVISEQTSEVIKVKVFLDKQRQGARAFNLDITNLRLDGKYVEFEYSTPGGGKQSAQRKFNKNGDEYMQWFTITKGTGSIQCGTNKSEITLLDESGYGIRYSQFKNGTSGWKDNGWGRQSIFYLTTEGFNKLHKLCDEYASIDNETSNSDMV